MDFEVFREVYTHWYTLLDPLDHMGHLVYMGEYTSLREKRVLKQYPWGTIATNGTLFSEGHS